MFRKGILLYVYKSSSKRTRVLTVELKKLKLNTTIGVSITRKGIQNTNKLIKFRINNTIDLAFLYI
jgi:hypothetical protein